MGYLVVKREISCVQEWACCAVDTPLLGIRTHTIYKLWYPDIYTLLRVYVKGTYKHLATQKINKTMITTNLSLSFNSNPFVYQMCIPPGGQHKNYIYILVKFEQFVLTIKFPLQYFRKGDTTIPP